MKNKFLSTILFGALSVASATSMAGVITLDFEGIGNQATIGDFYNGGTDSVGNSGVDYGISFGTDALACIDSDVSSMGCNFANEPTADTVMFFSSGSAVLNNSAGFDTGFSFYYSSAVATSINVYSDINKTGAILGTINLAANFTDNNCVGDPTGAFCNWDIASLGFTGIGKSIDFGGAVGNVGFDNITFGSTEPKPDVASVPEPSTLAIFALGIMGLASRRFKKNS